MQDAEVLTGVRRSAKPVTPHMIERRSGSIVLTSSTNGTEPGNRYRHPDPGLIGGLERAGAAVRRTDLTGDVAVVGSASALELVSRGSPLPAPR